MEGSCSSCVSVAVALALAAVWFSAGEMITASAVAVAVGVDPAKSGSEADAEFIRRSCKVTRYPHVCERSMVGYAGSVHRSRRQLARLALSLSLDRAGSAASFVSRQKSGPRDGSASQSLRRSRDAGAVRDCAETMRDSVERLRRSVQEMARMGPARSGRFAWRLSNVQTWVSAALTDQSTCLDSLAPQNINNDDASSSSSSSSSSLSLRSSIRTRVLSASQLTSNALALINCLSPRPPLN